MIVYTTDNNTPAYHLLQPNTYWKRVKYTKIMINGIIKDVIVWKQVEKNELNFK